MHNNLLDSQKFQSLIKGLTIPSIQQSLFLEEHNRKIIIVRDDLIHPVISGNKWRKLNHHLVHFSENKYEGITSMGGAYSNHLHALAFVCNELSIPCSLLIYGWNGELNSPTLNDCKKWNAQLVPITRKQAAMYRLDGQEVLLYDQQNIYFIPEGGGGILGSAGMNDLIKELPQDFDSNENLIVCASGTGTSVQGLLNSSTNCHIATMQIVKMASYSWMHNQRIKMIHSAEPNSFASRGQKIVDFIDYFERCFNIHLDPIYTAPLMYAFLNSKDLHVYNSIYFIHTGGLQANRIR